MQTAVTLFNRLREIEKGQLRGATPGRVEFLADTTYLVDLPDTDHAHRTRILTEVQALVNLEYATKSEGLAFGRTWLC